MESFEKFCQKQLLGKNGERTIMAFFDYKRDDVQSEEITIQWIARFSDYIRDRASSPNSQKTYFAIFKGIMNTAIRRGYNFPVSMMDVVAEMKTQKQASENIYTTKNELRMLEEYVPASKYETFARAVYLMCSYTGCRLLDHKYITENCIMDNTIVYTSDKTKVTARIPMHPIIPTLINELKQFNYTSQYQKDVVDTYIKIIFRNLGVTENVSFFKYGRRLIGEKCKYISAHVARISFATNLYIDGYSIEQIKRMMGHTNPEMTSNYIKVTINDFITGDRNYLNPYKADEIVLKIQAIVDGGISIKDAKVVMSVMGYKTSEIEQAFRNYEKTKETVSPIIL